ncbi:MAG: hypothetical protein D6744_11460 [Planctomycetota bacterium]|nr:MAG: hypothetical protein D6744_11460 [Planctomycetota bacterium]
MMATPSAWATFHLMQIEQVIGGVNGDTTAQAIQLRMRSLGQNLLAPSRIRAWDATGSNPIVIVDFGASVPNGAQGDRVLIASPSFTAATNPAATPDFMMANLIPPSYLAAGSLTFETDSGITVYWRLSWGGNGYSGPTNGSLNNDDDGDYGPPYPGPLPSADTRALLFQRAPGARSATNADDYALTGGDATFTNNAGDSFTVFTPIVCTADTDGDGDVDLTDLAVMLSNFGTASGATPEDGDTDGDGDVDLTDLAVLLSEFGAFCI